MSDQILKSPFSDISFDKSYNPGALYRNRFFICGPVKSGKSSLMASMPGAFVFDFEDKLRQIKDRYKNIIESFVPRSLEQVEKIVQWLCQEKKSKGDAFPVKHVVFDTGDEFLSGVLIPDLTKAKMTEDQINDGMNITDYGAGGGAGSKGWYMVTEAFLRQLKELYRAGFGWTVIGHLTESRQTIRTGGGLKEVTKSRPALNPATYRSLYRMAEFICLTSLRTTTVKGEKVEKKVGNKVVKIPGPSVEKTVGVLQVREGAGGSDQQIGSNISLPSEIILHEGKAYDCLNAEYLKAIEQESSNSEGVTKNG